MTKLQSLNDPADPTTFDEWMIPVSKRLELDGLKFPIVMVQEYGWSILRMSAAVTMALEQLPNCKIMTNTEVLDVQEKENDNGW